MNVHVIIALISGAFTFAGVVLSVWAGNKQTKAAVKQEADLTRYRIEQLEKKQDKHNTLIERMYAVEDRVNVLTERMNGLETLEHIEHKGA